MASSPPIPSTAFAHDSELRVLTALKDGPKHESEVCDRALVQVLERHGSIATYPAERGIMLEITDKGRAKL